MGRALPGRHRPRRLAPTHPCPSQGTREQLTDALSPSALNGVDHDLPARHAPFFGRSDEIRRLADAVTAGAVTTVVGPGGVGKTETALRAAPAAAARLGAAIRLVELASLTPDDVAAALDAAVESASARPLVVVADNAEHVADALRGWLDDEPAGVHTLVTSRVPVGAARERIVELPLLPPADAAALYTDRAGRAGATPSDASAVSELCRRLDFLPLAIELAAARARVLSPAAISTRLDDRFRTLGQNAAANPAHHRSLEAAMQWSHELLDDAERAALHRLSVFADRFDLDQADAVGVDLDTLSALVAHSLVASEPEAPVPYRLLESVRDFAAARRSAEEHSVAAAGLLAWARSVTVPLDGSETAVRDALHARLDATAVDVRRALEHAVGADPATAVVLMARLGPWFWDRGRAAEGLRLGRRISGVDPGGDPLATARLLNAVANLAVRTGAPDEALPLYEQALDLREAHGAALAQRASNRNDLGACYLHLGLLDKAEEALTVARAMYESAGDRWGVTTATMNLAAVAVTDGRLDGAAAAFGAVVDDFVRMGDEVQATAALTNQALVLLQIDDPRAPATFAAAVRMILRVGVRSVLPSALAGAATAAHRAGDAPRAARLWGAAQAGGFVDDAADMIRVELEDAVGVTAFRVLADEGAEASDESLLAWCDPSVAELAPRGREPHGRKPQVWEWRRNSTGRDWTASYQGEEVRLPGIKGMQYLARLLAEPGREIHAADLMGVAVAQTGSEVVDDAALAAYRHQIAALTARLDDADARGDAAAGEAVQAELDELTAEVRRATDKRGRARLVGDDSERARKAVANRIRDAVRAAAEAHPALGRHLEKAVVTGTFCRYAPEHPTRWNVSS